MVEYSKEAWPAKPVRREELAEALNPHLANCLRPQFRISTGSCATD
jgi:hypothetical protein